MSDSGRIPLWVLLAIATAFGLSSSIQAYWLSRVTTEPGGSLSHLIIMNMVYWWVPALVAPIIMWLATRFQFGRVQWYAAVGVHVAGAFTYSVLHTAAMLATRVALMPKPPAKGWWYAASVEFLTQLDWMFMTYLFLVGLAHARAYRRESERRALDSAKLETRVVEAQLQALQRQLHPHFLFNTLNTIAGLMRSDVNTADKIIDRLGDLLRMTLHTSNIQELPLKEELEMLQKYLDIEQLRLGSRLSVSMHIDPRALDALVPNLLLQPLVENAVRYGVAPHARQGRISVTARVDGPHVVMNIGDSGDGVAPHRLTLLNQGIGLANTRARLDHLYPGAHELLFSNLPGGFEVTVRIPFTADRTALEPVRAVVA